MLILAIDSSTRSGSLALLGDETVLGQIVDFSEPYSSRLCSDVEALLSGHDISLLQLDLLAVAAGPGSFTGLRVGLTAVKAWAEVFRKPIVAVSALEAVAMAVNPCSTGISGGVVAVLDARRQQIFGGFYRCCGEGSGELRLVDEETVGGVVELLRFVGQEAGDVLPIFASPTPQVIRSAIEDSPLAGCRVEEVSPTLAPIIGRIGYRRALRGQVTDAMHLDANYVRRTDAELKWKDG